MEYYTVIKRNEVLIQATTWVNLETIMLSEGNHKRPHMIWFHLYEISRMVRFFFFFWPQGMACRISVPQPGIDLQAPAVKVLHPFHYTIMEFSKNDQILFFFFKLYNIVLVLPNIEMNPPQVYLCSPSWTLLPSPSLYPPSGLSQCTSPKHPLSCIEPGLATHFIHDILL